MNKKNILIAAGISGALCVALGAMAAHALKDLLPQENLQTFETAVKYQFYHTLALLVIALLPEKYTSKLFAYASGFFISGIILFSFSLYFLALRPLMGMSGEEMKWIGAITPLGGVSFIAGWIMLAFAGFSSPKTQP